MRIAIYGLLAIGLISISPKSHGYMPSIDILTFKDWNEFSQKEKMIFLSGFFHSLEGRFPTKHSDAGYIVLKIPNDMVERIDIFYENADNRKVRIRGVIEIELLRIEGTDIKIIDKIIEYERRLVITSW